MIINPVKINLKVKLPQKLKWGVAFNKNFDLQNYLSAIQLLAKSKIVSILCSDVNEAKAIAEKYGIPNYTDDLENFLSNDIDVIYLADNTIDFVKHFEIFLNRKKNIVCEKPLILPYEQLLYLNELIQKNNNQIIVNYSHRFNPLVIKAKELIAKGAVGKIHSISASYHIDFTPDDSSIYKNKLSGISALRDLGHQMLDLLRFLGGEITEVKSYSDKLLYQNTENDFFTASLKYENNYYGNLSVSYLSKKSVNRIEILGYNGSLIIENIFDKKKASTILIIDLFNEAKKVFRKKVNKTFMMLKYSQKVFLKKELLQPDFYEALKNIKIIEQIENNFRIKK